VPAQAAIDSAASAAALRRTKDMFQPPDDLNRPAIPIGQCPRLS
jgi:hypothetical protein